MTIGWKILAGLLLVAALFAGEQAYEHHIYQQGVDVTNAKRDKREADANLAAANELTAANEKIRALGLQLVRQLDKIAQLEESEKQNAKVHEDTLRADVRSGAIRLRMPVQNCKVGKAGPDNGAGTAGGIDNQASAELLPATADALVSIAFDANAEVRRTNQCIDRYEAVRKAVNSAAQMADTKQDIGDHVEGDPIADKTKEK